ncbi:MAG: RNA 2',3'-cyclic phosphodiesterase [Alphaproteobacteria bacterium]|nr:RNA 2',3'-cyclic phosphodiesterase [Alphaproteobacteria bacterium]MDE2110937.1 RNA 2',3'-cyclic phosphodiesterase [Alphaproteobacteria bacterium]MDE2495420.1 RNA 2',3'-cyclic phosphodiesterase [Alphaproteobacteria bacterium]
MMRLFVAIALPEGVARSLAVLQAGVPGARWQTREQLHLTLRFIGEVDGRDAAAIDDTLAAISSPTFSIELKGVGAFGGKRPYALWVGAVANQALHHLQRKIESALQRIGLKADGRKYMPHVTLAKLKGTQTSRVIDFLTDYALYGSSPFTVANFVLYSSQLTPNGSVYRAEKSYQLD